MKQKKHILMVDDVATNLKCAGEVLKSNYEISKAKSGQEALKALPEIKPDMIILDINMPEMDGFETMVKIKEISGYKEIPVIFLTADAEEESRLRGFKLGAVDFIRKPFDPMFLISRIERAFELEEAKKKLMEE